MTISEIGTAVFFGIITDFVLRGIRYVTCRLHWRFYAFLGIDKEKVLHVVCGGYPDIKASKKRITENGGTEPKEFTLHSPVSKDEYEPFVEIVKAFSHEHQSDIVLVTDEDQKDASSADVICLGGQQSNNGTFEIFHSRSLSFQPIQHWPEENGQTLNITGYSWKLVHKADQEDYAVILKTKAKCGAIKSVIAGFTNLGTRGGAYYFAHNWKLIYKKISWWKYYFPFYVTIPNFLCIVKFSEKKNYKDGELVGLYVEGRGHYIKPIIPIKEQ